MTPEKAYWKALKAGKRMPDLEHIILTDPWGSYRYARYIIKARWEEAEEVIMTNSFISFRYAAWIIRGRLPPKMHNRMLLCAIEDPDDEYVKDYFEFLDGFFTGFEQENYCCSVKKPNSIVS